jgi:hypothetical protein
MVAKKHEQKVRKKPGKKLRLRLMKTETVT